jgi:capsular polysaccharide biosynthesis protein
MDEKMYLQQVLASLRRRWLLTCSALLVAVAMGYAASGYVGPTYTSESSLVLVPPPTTSRVVNSDGTETDGNPYMYLGGLTEARDVLIKAMSSETVHEEVSKEAGSGTYIVTPDYDTPAPIVVIATTAPSSAVARAVTKAVLAQVPTVLAQIQEQLSIPHDALITTRVVTADPVLPNHKKQMRLVALAVLAMLVVLALLIAVVDGLLLRRRARRAAPDSEAAGDGLTEVVRPGAADRDPESAPPPEDEKGDEPATQPDDQDAVAAARRTPRPPRGKRPRKERRRSVHAPIPAAPVKGVGVAARGGAARAAS